MKSLSSTDFRKVYAALEEPTEVFVHGHLIGTWFPVGSLSYPTGEAPRDFGSQVAMRGGLPKEVAARIDAIEAPRPVPKPGRKK